MFKKKVWKRGDKLNAKELNRIEDGIANNDNGGGAEFPEVTAADNGDVLGVVDGNWAKMELPQELPTATTSDIGKALIVTSDGTWGAGNPARTNGTMFSGVLDTNTGAITLNVTASDLSSQANYRQTIFQLTVGGDTVYVFGWLVIQQIDNYYNFAMMNGEGIIYKTARLTGNENVIFTPMS